MHDLEFEHLHVSAEDAAVNEVAWAADNVELMTVGIDIGSSTSHLMFARVHLQRLGGRAVEPIRGGRPQDPMAVADPAHPLSVRLHHRCGRSSQASSAAVTPLPGIEREKVDSGAVILTGEALKRRNARAIADLFSEEAGKFVCASAGHHMECQMAAHGSGAIALSRGHGATVLNVDIGGGTTKFALIEKGRILATCALAVGRPPRGRGGAGKASTRVEPPAQEVAQALRHRSAPAAAARRQRIASGSPRRMGRMIMGMIDLRQPGELAQRLMVTEPWPGALANKRIDALTFSGGVAEYLYKRETRRFGDLGSDLAEELRHALAHRRDLPPVWDPGQGIRATVIGAAQFSVQISGNTILIADPAKLPLQNLPVLACNFELGWRGRPWRSCCRGPLRPRQGGFRGRRKSRRTRIPVARGPFARAPARARSRYLRCASAHARRAMAAGPAGGRRCRQKPRPHHPA